MGKVHTRYTEAHHQALVEEADLGEGWTYSWLLTSPNLARILKVALEEWRERKEMSSITTMVPGHTKAIWSSMVPNAPEVTLVLFPLFWAFILQIY